MPRLSRNFSRHHSFIHSPWQWIWTSDRVHPRVRGKGTKWGEGWKGEFLVLSRLFDLLTHQTWLTPIPPPLDISFLPRALRIIFSDISQAARSRRKKRTPTVHHGFCGSLIYLFYTLHSSTDGLSIDFDLTVLCSAVCTWVGVGSGSLSLDNSYCWFQQQSHHQHDWDFFCVWIYPHLLKVQKFSKSFPQLWEKDKVLTGGEKAFAAEHKIKLLVRADMFLWVVQTVRVASPQCQVKDG